MLNPFSRVELIVEMIPSIVERNNPNQMKPIIPLV